MKKTVQIVTIPIDKKGFSKEDLCKCIKPLISGDTEGQMIIATHTATDENNPYWQAQQLLVLSDDEIKEGDVKHSRNCEPFKKVIASYPQIEGTLTISKETIQAWIDAGTPGEVTLKEALRGSMCLDPQGNLLLEFAQPFKSTMPIYTVPSIPTDEEIKKTARALRNQEFEKRKECLAEDLIIDPLSTYEIGIIIGYKQALKDLGYE